MAAKKSAGPARGASLVKKAIESHGAAIESPEPVPASVLKKLRLPNDEKLSPGLKTFLAHDSSLLGWSFDDEEPELEPMSFEELVAQELGDESVSAFGEACEMLDGDCVLIEGGEGPTRFLYVGTPDEQGEYPVITLTNDGAPRVSGFVPFDVFVAQRLGAVAEPEPGGVPDEYAPAAQALADANGDGRRAFEPQFREIATERDEDEDEDEDETGEEG